MVALTAKRCRRFRESFMSEEWARLSLRLPNALKEWLASEARMSRRSINAEFVHRLESARKADCLVSPSGSEMVMGRMSSA